MNIVQRLMGAALESKALTRISHPTQSNPAWALLPRTRRNYARETNFGADSSIVLAAINWIARNFPEAPVEVVRRTGPREFEPIPDHPMVSLLEMPNPEYSGVDLWMASMYDYVIDGNVYWAKIRTRGGEVVQLWWLPHHMVEPKGTESQLITHYEYRPNPTTKVRIDREDMVHLRFGMDPENPRRGMSQVRSVLREVFTDEEAANFSASVLSNFGIPGVIISPKISDRQLGLPDVDAETIKNVYSAKFTGDRRGEPLVMTTPTDLQVVSWNPAELDLKMLRRVPEERVSAVLGIPATVLGLGAGLDRCLPADAKVWTENGPVPIIDVSVGDKVWSVKDGEVVLQKVTNHAQASSRNVFTVKTKNKTLRASGNHPVLVRVPGDLKGKKVSYEYKLVEDLTTEDYVVQVKELPDTGNEILPTGDILTEEMAQWMGAMFGDGNIVNGHISMSMPPTDRCVDQYRDLATSLFSKQSHPSGGGVAVQEVIDRQPITIVQNERSFIFSSAKDCRALDRLGISGTAKSKRVPKWMFSMSNSLKLRFLAGIVDTDGYVDSRGCLTITLANKELIQDIKYLLQSVGMQSSNLLEINIPSNRLPNEGLYESYLAWSITVSDATRVGQIPFVDPVYRERVLANLSRTRKTGKDAYKTDLDDSMLGFFKVVSIEEGEIEDLYDIEVAGGHNNFIAEGIVVSNSTFNNYFEARESAYENNILPTQRQMAASLRLQLLPDFEPNVTEFRVRFDISNVRALQEDVTAEFERSTMGVLGGFMRVSEGRSRVGLAPDDGDNIYLRDKKYIEVTAGEQGQTVEDITQSQTQSSSVQGEEGEQSILEGVFPNLPVKRELRSRRNGKTADSRVLN